MRKLAIALAGAAALTFASAAQATITVDALGTTVHVTDQFDAADGQSGYINYEKDANDTADFSETLAFSNDIAGIYNLYVTTQVGSVVSFDSLTISGGSLNMSFDGPAFFLGTYTWSLEDLHLDAATNYVITLTGDAPVGTTFQGHLSYNAVPEPAAWAMMLVGFGAIGASMRRRRSRFAVRQLA